MVYLILSALFFAFNNILWKWVVAVHLPLQVIVKRSIITSLIGGVVLIFNYDDLLFYNTIKQFAFVNLTCVIGALGLVFMVYGIKQSSLSMFIHYSLLGAIVTASYLYFVENIIPKNYAIGTLCLSLGFFVFLRNQRHDIKKINISTHRYLFIMSMCFSANGIMQWYNLKTYDVVFLAVHQELTVLIIAAFCCTF